jgi:pimeloyl-ACP methyl ester carboxylesterase
MTSIILHRSKTDRGIAYHRTGNTSGIPVVLVHGVGLRSESWYQQIDALQHDYDVFAVDMPGHGESQTIGEPNPDLSDFIECLALFVETVVRQPAVIVGHSMGALLSLSLAKARPDLCKAIVPMNAIYQRSDDAKRAVLARAKNLRTAPQSNPTAPVKRWFSDTPSAQDKVHAALCRDWLQTNDLKGYADAYTVFSEEDGLSEAALQSLQLPCLFITGELDANSSPAMTETMSRHVSHAESLIIKGSRHMTPLTHATEVNPALLSFFEASL